MSITITVSLSGGNLLETYLNSRIFAEAVVQFGVSDVKLCLVLLSHETVTKWGVSYGKIHTSVEILVEHQVHGVGVHILIVHAATDRTHGHLIRMIHLKILQAQKGRALFGVGSQDGSGPIEG